MLKTNNEVFTVDLPLAAYAISKYRAILSKTDILEGRVRFFLALKEKDGLIQISRDFNADGHVCGRLYSQELRRLKSLVAKAKAEQELFL